MIFLLDHWHLSAITRTIQYSHIKRTIVLESIYADEFQTEFYFSSMKLILRNSTGVLVNRLAQRGARDNELLQDVTEFANSVASG